MTDPSSQRVGRIAPPLTSWKRESDFTRAEAQSVMRTLLASPKYSASGVELCREMCLLATASIAVDGSKFKAVNNGDKTFTRAKVERRVALIVALRNLHTSGSNLTFGARV
jgi:hypothetical protein